MNRKPGKRNILMEGIMGGKEEKRKKLKENCVKYWKQWR